MKMPLTLSLLCTLFVTAPALAQHTMQTVTQYAGQASIQQSAPYAGQVAAPVYSNGQQYQWQLVPVAPAQAAAPITPQYLPAAPVAQATVPAAPVVQAVESVPAVVAAPVVEAPAVVQAPIVQAPIVQAPIVQAPIVQAPIVQAPVVQAAPVMATPAPQVIIVQVPVPAPAPQVNFMSYRESLYTAPAPIYAPAPRRKGCCLFGR